MVTVHCPNHLARQWKEEIEKNTKNMKIAVICTIVDFRKYTVDDLCNYGKASEGFGRGSKAHCYLDLVVVSFQFLENNNYLSFCGTSGPAAKKKKTAPLQQFSWYRIILDEGHEIISGIKDMKTNRGYARKKQCTINNPFIFSPVLS